MLVDTREQARSFALRLDGVPAALEKRNRKHSHLLLVLTNTRPTPATVIVRSQGARVVEFVLLPFQRG